MTSGPPRDSFEDELRDALAREAGGPAPERLVVRVRGLSGERPRSWVSGEAVRSWFGPRPRPLLGLGFGLVALVVVVLAAGPLLRGYLPGPPTSPSAGAASGPASGAPTGSGPAAVTPSGADSGHSPSIAPSGAATATARPPATPTGSLAGGPVPAGFEPVSVTFVSASHGWLLGDAPCGSATCPAIVRTSDGGRTWASIPAPGTSLNRQGGLSGSGVSGLRFADALDGWAYGPELWATHDGGASWQRVTPPGVGAGGGVAALEAAGGLVHAAVFSGGSTIRIATSPVGADRWALAGTGLEIGAGPVPQPQLVLHGSAGWFVEIDRTVVDGARLSSGSWTSWQPPCLDAMGPARIAAASASGLVAACDVGQWATPQGVHLFTSNDAGATFVEATAGVPTSDVEAIAAAPSSQTVVVAGTLSGGGAGLVASFDGGKTWSTAYEPKGATSIAELGFTTASQGVAIVTAAGGSSGLVMTADGGRSWTPVPVAGA